MIKKLLLILIVLFYVFCLIQGGIWGGQTGFLIGKPIAAFLGGELGLIDEPLGLSVGFILVVLGASCIFLIKPKNLMLPFVNLKSFFTLKTIFSYLLFGFSFGFASGVVLAGIIIALINLL